MDLLYGLIGDSPWENHRCLREACIHMYAPPRTSRSSHRKAVGLRWSNCHRVWSRRFHCLHCPDNCHRSSRLGSGLKWQQNIINIPFIDNPYEMKSLVRIKLSC